jgi:tungstate transport system substrate-binding protein
MFIMMTILSLRRQYFACCIALFLFLISLSAIPASAGQQPIIVQSTTSTLNSGLYDYLLPFYQRATGKQVRVVAVGTGQALKNAERCDGDVLIVHSHEDEINFIEQGFGSKRYNLMYNDFVLLGPYHDPAGIADADNISAALRLIAQAGIRFVSRGDNSGTHKAEKRFWEIADNVPAAKAGSWYIESGQGMGSTLNLAVQMQGYVLSDRATWLAFANKQNHAILFSGDPDMFNQYGIIPISPDHCPNTYNEDGLLFTKWMISEAGQQLISAYKRGGEQLFFPNADRF